MGGAAGWVRGVVGAVGLLAGVGGAGCAHRVPMVSAGPVSADGRITVIDKANGVRVFNVRVRDLTAPEHTVAGSRAYVAWAAVGADTAYNIGALRFTDGNIAVLEAVAPADASLVFVTAEPHAEVNSPSIHRVFFAVVADRVPDHL